MTGQLGVAIMAGGKGKRLRAYTGNLPKALAPFAGTTLLDYQIERISSLYPQRIYVLAYYKAEAIRTYISRYGNHTPNVELIVAKQDLGTAGGLYLLPNDPATWLVINVDNVSDVNLNHFVATACFPCTAMLADTEILIDEGVVEYKEGLIKTWNERPHLHFSVTIGLYVFQRKVFNDVLNGEKLDMPDLIRRLIPYGVHVYKHEGTWFDAGTPDRIAAAERWFQNSIREAHKDK